MKSNIKIATPIGTAVWPSLNEPDYRFDENGTYNVRLRLYPADNEEHGAFIDRITAMYEEAVEHELSQLTKAKRKAAADAGRERATSPVRPVRDEDGDETGEFEINFKMKASGVSKKTNERWTRRPTIFDAANNRISVPIGGGSQIRVSATANSFMMGSVGAGLSLRLEAVQVIELVEPGGTASSFGFDEVEGGFEADEDSSPVATTAGDDDSDF